MICAVMQPTYLPWSGYFNLIFSSEVFVLLDDVQFEKQSWQSRNRMLLNGAAHFLTVPIRRTGLDTLISEAEINYDQDWVKNHLRSLEQGYARAPYLRDALDLIAPILQAKPQLMADLNISIIEACAQRLELPARLVRASTLNCSGKRSEHVAEICHAVGATHYLSPRGSRDYMQQDDFSGTAGLPVSYQDYEPGTYRQRVTKEFVSHLSLIDVVVHLGWADAAEYVRRSHWTSNKEQKT